MDEQNILEEENDDFFDVAGDVLAAPFRGVEGAFQGAYNLADYISFDVLPDYDTRFLGTSKTMAGGAVEGISQFATGFIPLFGLAGRAGALAKAGTVTKGVVAGAATDFTFFNGQEARLSNLIQQVPELQNPVTEFLAHDEDEGELEGRMKNVLEGLGLEAVAGVFIKSLKAIKNGRDVKTQGGTAEQQAQVVNDTLEGGKDFADLPDFKFIDDEARLLREIETDKVAVANEERDLKSILDKEKAGETIDDWQKGLREDRLDKFKTDLKNNEEALDKLKARKSFEKQPELQEKLEEFDVGIEELDEVIATRPPPYQTYEDAGMLDVKPRGAANIIRRLRQPNVLKDADPSDVKDIEKFIDVIGTRLFDDVAQPMITNKIPAAGRYEFGSNLLKIRSEVVKEGGLKRTMVHELWHSLSRYLPEKDLTKITKEFQRERNKYIQSFGIEIKDLEVEFDPSTVTRKDIPKELDRFLRGKRGDFNNANYRYKDIDEYFAEEMSDAWFKKEAAGKLAPSGSPKRIAQEFAIFFKDLFESLKAKLGIDQRQKIFNDFLKQRNVKVQRQSSLRPGEVSFAELPDFKKGKEDEFLSAIPDKFRGYAEALMVGGVKPRLPQFALETGEDAIVLKELLEQYYTANPDKIDVKGVVVEIDEALDFDYESLGQDIKDIEKSELDKQIRQQSLRDQGHALSLNIIENVEEAKKAGYGTVSVSKLKNSFQQLLTVADAYRKIGRGTAQSLQARRENFRRKKIGLSETESEIEGLRNEFVNNSGNMKPEKMVKRIEEIIDPNDLDGSFAGLFKLAKKAQGKSFLDMPTEYWMNSILSGPRTQMVNIVGNSLTQVMTTLETVAGGIVSGNLDIVKASLASWSDGEMWKEAAKFAKQSFKEQENILDPTNRAFEESARGAITGERVADSFMGRFVSEKGLRSKEAIDAYGNFIRLPGRLLLTTDEFFKQIAYRRAARLKAAMSGINQGIIDPKKLADHINSTVDKVVTEGGRVMSEESLVREASKIADSKGLKDKQKADFIIDYKNENFNEGASALAQYSADEAQYLTFTKELQEGTLGKGLQNLTNQIPFLRLVLPFVRTPTNILSFAFERTPGVFMPGVLKEERSRLISDLKSDDPVEKSRALGKMLTATLTGGTLIDVVANNREFITGGGPKDEKQKASLLATGWKPYSIKIGDTYYSYQRLDPIATIIGTAADIVDTGFRSPRGFNDSKLEHGFAALTLALTRNATNKSYLAGIQMWSNALGDPDRYLEKLGRNYAGSFVPNVMSQMQDYDTQVMKEVNSWKDAVIRKLPFGRGGLDNKRNILGEELIAEQSPEYLGFINPISSSTAKSDPIINEMASLKHAFRQLVPKLGSINLLDYENTKGQSAYDRQLELLKTVKVGGSTLRQTLGKLIKSKTYQNLPTESLPGLPSPRIDKITSVLSRFKKESRKKMLKEFPELDQQYSVLTGAQSAFKRGVSRQEVLELLQQTN